MNNWDVFVILIVGVDLFRFLFQWLLEGILKELKKGIAVSH